MLYSGLKRVGTAKFRVDDNETNGPIDNNGKADQKNSASNETSVLEGVGLTDDAGAAAHVSIPSRIVYS
jgi:hypothetical protein